MATHYLTVSWDEFHRDAKALAERLASAGPWRGIVAISRGGLVPATIIARALNIRVVETVSVVAYDQLAQGRGIARRTQGDQIARLRRRRRGDF